MNPEKKDLYKSALIDSLLGLICISSFYMSNHAEIKLVFILIAFFFNLKSLYYIACASKIKED